jgi:hypothetical protein
VLCSTLFFVASCAIHISELSFFLITLQEKIDTVGVEGVENVGEEDSIEIKTEQHYIQLVRTVKGEQEVSVLFMWACFVVCVHVCVCVCARMCVVLYILFSYARFLYGPVTSF